MFALVVAGGGDAGAEEFDAGDDAELAEWRVDGNTSFVESFVDTGRVFIERSVADELGDEDLALLEVESGALGVEVCVVGVEGKGGVFDGVGEESDVVEVALSISAGVVVSDVVESRLEDEAEVNGAVDGALASATT